jgi:hypothetical protein
MTRLFIVAALLGTLALPAAAQAAPPRWGLTASGDPLLERDALSGRTVAPWMEWWACPPQQGCRIISEDAVRLEPGETARGTVFESVGWDTNVRGPMWLGRVTAARPVRLAGDPTPGGTVRVSRAGWTGGWGNEASDTVVLACPSLANANCEALTGPLTEKHRGWYLYAVEWRRSPAAAPVPVSTARPAPSALVSVSVPVGPVGNDADVLVSNRGARTVRRVTVGRVTCQGCRVELRVASVRRTFTVRGTRALSVPASNVRDAGRVRVTVTVDGLQLVSRRVRLAR